MNCKPRDVVLIVRGEPENIGIMARVLRPEFDAEMGGWVWQFEDASRPVQQWTWIDGLDYSPRSGAYLSTADDPKYEASLWDADLMPLRDQPGADETLTWTGKPAETKQPEPVSA